MTIHRLTALELKAALDRRDLSSVEIVDALIRRREAVEPIVNAFVDRFDAAARKEAEKADAARARGESLGALHGLPITIKESMANAGLPNQDDVVLALMVALEGAARSDADFPTTPVDPT